MITMLQYKRKIIKQMEAVGTYKKEFSIVIETLAKLMVDYDKTLAEFEESGSNIIISHTNKAGKENMIKNPMYLAIEMMRKQILEYLQELGLTPSGLKKINKKGLGAKKETTFTKAMNKYG